MVEKKSKKGHWPAGKRRNPDNGDWETVRLGIIALIDEHGECGVISWRALAAACGVDPKSANNWSHGIDRPSLESQLIARQWLKERRVEIKSRRH